jgi:hypothetical protein
LPAARIFSGRIIAPHFRALANPAFTIKGNGNALKTHWRKICAVVGKAGVTGRAAAFFRTASNAQRALP